MDDEPELTEKLKRRLAWTVSGLMVGISAVFLILVLAATNKKEVVRYKEVPVQVEVPVIIEKPILEPAPPVISEATRVRAEVDRIKRCLKYGWNSAQVESAIARQPDKWETYIVDNYIRDFEFKVDVFALVHRYLPFEVPGVVEPRYRVNLLFTNKGLTNWYFRSPD